MEDLYSILEVNPNASMEVIHAAYRTLALKYKDDHPKLKSLNLSKDVLLDKAKRKEYDESLSDGKIIDDYRILKVIAEGGFGKTYHAQHLILEKDVCIKHASKVSAFDRKLLLEEARAIWDLRHYAIPAMRDIIELPDGGIALVMSYIPGPTLQQLIEKHKRLDPEHVAWISERVLNVLKYMHFHGVVHGDIKPANIIIQPDSHMVVVVDYGLSLIRPSRDEKNKGFTPAFAAPEQETGNVLVPETDFYGLGLTMIAALGGKIKTREIPNSTPSGLTDIISSYIKYNPLARPRWKRYEDDAEGEDLIKTLQEAREKDFGRKSSNMKPLPTI